MSLHVIMPIKDSMSTARQAIEALMSSGVDLTVYNDFSTAQTTAELTELSRRYGFALVNWADHTDHPSPNYRLTLIDSQQACIRSGSHLVVVESDVTVRADTLHRLESEVGQGIGMVAAVTEDESGSVNFPYRYAHRMRGGARPCRKRFSFCCTLLSLELLQAFDFHELDPEKSWYDVFISHHSLQLGFTNLIMPDNRVLHRPHSSRPWKRLKYTNPLRYYWQKIVQKRDRI